jgi:hypothetical protein
MRLTRLLRTAIEAQIALSKSSGRTAVRKGVFLAVAGLFGLAAFTMLHVAAYDALAVGARIAPAWSALIVVGVDLVFAAVLAVLARTGGPDARGVKARIDRDMALNDLRSGFAIAAVAGPAGRFAGRGALGLLRRLFFSRRSRRR